MNVRLIDIIHKPEWERAHKLRGIEIDGRCGVAEDLVQLSRHDSGDFKKIMKVIRLVGEQERLLNERHVTRGKKHTEIYEIRAHRGHARLYFFYTPDKQEVVVCTNSYWKTKPSFREQNEAFERAERLRQRYLESLQKRVR